jgi:hypothetical protein
MLDRLRATETVSGYTIRAWTGEATDEGVGLISMVEVMDGSGVPVCRFEEFLGDGVRLVDASWPRDVVAALVALQDRALERARSAVNGGRLHEEHGHRYDVSVGSSGLTRPRRPGS